MKINKNEFETLLSSINCCYAKDCIAKLPSIKDFPDNIFDKYNYVDLDYLLSFAKSITNVYFKSVCYRILSIIKFKNSRDNNTVLDIKYIWKYIYDSIMIIPNNSTISSIGSQGFLSIPLYKFENDKNNFDFIRMHIWDKSLSSYINQDKCDKFSIHTHSFYAQSWILCGKIINKRFKVDLSKHITDKALFTIEYNKTLNEVNQHTSSAVNTNNYVDINQIGHEEYIQGTTYIVDAGNYHSSISASKDDVSATLFSFTGKSGLVEQSYVVGPSEILSSEINRKMYIDPSELLNKIQNQII
jgi:hypothetical protein